MKYILVIIIGVFLFRSSDECKSYSDFTCKQIQDAKYNVYFYYPNQTEVYLGRAEGLESCNYISRQFASQKKLLGSNWGYICCMVAKGSSCYEKHR